MTRLRGILFATLASAFAASGALAQESSLPQDPAGDLDAERRAAVLAVLARDEIRSAARIADLDLDATTAALATLEGAPLERAERQARALDRRLEAQDTITISATTLIIILILIAIIIVVA